MRKATEAEVLALDDLAREMRARQRAKADDATTRPIPFMSIQECADLYFAELAGKVGGR